jgi:hypothetical protein
LLTQILDHNSDFYVEKEVIYWTFSLKNWVFVKGKDKHEQMKKSLG